ncbi:hypothetical protein RJ639_019134 [Escallonia herrerae]|uniref:non-specific serine/threonine protein kinase n=1 Tax=Escallonia herrerae TaxID=1293975 RepID=A0AA88V9J3_9ASTE|nr:hypothetical protein RJ639_019134 [Escallonia herrerae]
MGVNGVNDITVGRFRPTKYFLSKKITLTQFCSEPISSSIMAQTLSHRVDYVSEFNSKPASNPRIFAASLDQLYLANEIVPQKEKFNLLPYSCLEMIGNIPRRLNQDESYGSFQGVRQFRCSSVFYAITKMKGGQYIFGSLVDLDEILCSISKYLMILAFARIKVILAMPSVLLHLLFLMSLVPSSAVAQTNGTITVGASLTATDSATPWLSLAGDFAFGFQQLGKSDMFLLSIWYHKIPEQTITWYANGDNPAPGGSEVELTADRGLVLTDPQGEETMISDPIVGSVAYGTMMDTGNFVLANPNFESLWESYDHATDTILPSQTLEVGGVLSSRLTETNFSRGRFQLNFVANGNVELGTVNLPGVYENEPYYSNGMKAGSNSTTYQLVFNISAYIYISGDNNQKFALSRGELSSGLDFYHGATLNFDGTFMHYRRPKTTTGNESWSAQWSMPDNICVQSFEPAENLYDFYTVRNIDWPTSDYELLQPYDDDKCKASCLDDCMCAVAISGGNRCWKKKLPLSNGRVDDILNKKAFIKTKKSNSTSQNLGSSSPSKKNQDAVILLVFVFLGSSAFINFVLLGVICLRFMLIYNNKLTRNRKAESGLERNLRCFTYRELLNATNGFKEELGRGSFGFVYKGVAEMSSSSLVAVKKLDRIQDGDNEFKTEVDVIGQTHHKNLVRLLGFCDEGAHRMLLGSKTQIAIGIARGLFYLHDECSNRIIHCDVKPQNILLDDYYSARISDFGLAKLLRMDKSETHTVIRGTEGYVAPEWFRNMPITVKADMYSFGVLLLEIICSRRNLDMEIGEDKAILTYWAYDCYLEGTIDALVEDDMDAISDQKKLRRFLMIAIWCIQEDPYLRPTMKKVLLMLEGIVDVTAPPSPSPFSTIKSPSVSHFVACKKVGSSLLNFSTSPILMRHHFALDSAAFRY